MGERDAVELCRDEVCDVVGRQWLQHGRVQQPVPREAGANWRASRGILGATWWLAEGSKLDERVDEQNRLIRYEYDRNHRRTIQRVFDRDANNAVVDEHVTEYSWDNRDLLRQVTLPDGTMVRFRYDAFRRRIDKMVVAPDGVTQASRLERLASGGELSPVRRERYLYDGAVICGETFVVEPYAAGKKEEREATLMSMLLTDLPELEGDDAGTGTGSGAGSGSGSGSGSKAAADAAADAAAAAAAGAEPISRVHVHVPGTLVPLLQHEADRGETFTVVTDHIGTPKELVGRGGTVAWAARHSAYARVLEADIDAEYDGAGKDAHRAVTSPFRHLGQHFDADLGLCHTRYRWFDPDSAGWLTPDPLGLAGGRNLFGFDGAPSWEVDPWGLSCEAGKLEPLGGRTWRSKQGLIYGPGSKHGNRVKHVLEHAQADSAKTKHSVFNVPRGKVIGLVDEAWSQRGAAEAGDPGAYVVPMGRDVGTNGERSVRIIVRPGTSEVISAYPWSAP